jgi:hypothetical protein
VPLTHPGLLFAKNKSSMMLNAEGHLREQAHDYDAAEDDV